MNIKSLNQLYNNKQETKNQDNVQKIFTNHAVDGVYGALGGLRRKRENELGKKQNNMCTYNISIEDTLIEQLRPTLGADSDVNDWMQRQIELAVLRCIQQHKNRSKRQDSIRRIIALSEADGSTISLRDFEGILPAPQTSLEELRDEYISEKYGV